jgi:hypothetical protein
MGKTAIGEWHKKVYSGFSKTRILSIILFILPITLFVILLFPSFSNFY